MSPIQFAVRPAMATTADPHITELRGQMFMMVGNTGASPARAVAIAGKRAVDYYVDYPEHKKYFAPHTGVLARLAMGRIVLLDEIMPALHVVQRLLAGSYGMPRTGEDPFGHLPIPALLCDVTCLSPRSLADIQRTAALLNPRWSPHLPKRPTPADLPLATIAAIEWAVEMATHDKISLAAFEAQHPTDGQRIGHLLLARSAENQQLLLDANMRRSLRRFAEYVQTAAQVAASRDKGRAAQTPS